MTPETQLSTCNIDNLPDTLPLFTISGAILLPHTKQPLNIFEEPYLKMVDAALGHGRYIGVIQPSIETPDQDTAPLFKVGTLSRIISFSETDDARYLINLQGLCRFNLVEELSLENGYRRGKIDVQPYANDFEMHAEHDFDRTRLTQSLAGYFKTHGVSADWNLVQTAASEELVSSLTMICPLEPNEKQALLEAPTFRARVDLLITLLEMASMSQDDGETARH
ncbi:MAG: LON peptidase substrate-binding domain-containing protein [Alphaproteobacteria bacterium]|nr:LON peptidase substrate-binding domain-containing protein [Alphaproteobacteria bacterium]